MKYVLTKSDGQIEAVKSGLVFHDRNVSLQREPAEIDGTIQGLRG